jgi:hypothetical protein
MTLKYATHKLSLKAEIYLKVVLSFLHQFNRIIGFSNNYTTVF